MSWGWCTSKVQAMNAKDYISLLDTEQYLWMLEYQFKNSAWSLSVDSSNIDNA